MGVSRSISFKYKYITFFNFTGFVCTMLNGALLEGLDIKFGSELIYPKN